MFHPLEQFFIFFTFLTTVPQTLVTYFQQHLLIVSLSGINLRVNKFLYLVSSERNTNHNYWNINLADIFCNSVINNLNNGSVIAILICVNVQVYEKKKQRYKGNDGWSKVVLVIKLDGCDFVNKKFDLRNFFFFSLIS